MTSINKKNHWENIYQSKSFEEVSWYQTEPTISLEFLKELKIPLDAKIIDIGGGDSYFVDHLISLGYQNITVLDISELALEKARERLKEKADRVQWIVADISKFEVEEKFDFWHDRAAFHFLTSDTEINSYIEILNKSMNKNGSIVIGTFSEAGPTKCSGIDIKQYSEQSLSQRLSVFFKKIRCVNVDHLTPFNTIQNFVFCSFMKLKNDTFVKTSAI